MNINSIARAAARAVGKPHTFHGQLYARFIEGAYDARDAMAQFVYLDRAAAADAGWRTISGVHVHIGEDGTVDKGPAALKGKTHAEATKHATEHDHDAADPHVHAERRVRRQLEGLAGRGADKMPLHKARLTLGHDHPLVRELARSNVFNADAKPSAERDEYVAGETREDSLNRYRVQRKLGIDVARPKHGSELGYRNDDTQKKFESFLDSEYEAKHGVIDEDDRRGFQDKYGTTHDYDNGDVVGDLIHHATTEPAAEGKAKVYTKTGIESRLMKHHEENGGTYDDVHDDEGNRLDLTPSQMTFADKLPTEVKEYVTQGRKKLLRLLKVAKTADEKRNANGADAFAQHGDKYLDALERLGTSRVDQAVDAAKRGNDPEMQFLAKVHEEGQIGEASEGQKAANRDAARRGEGPTKREKTTHLLHFPTTDLQAGHSFTIHGQRFNVDEPEEGERVVTGPVHWPELHLDAMDHVPIDKGSLRRRKGMEPMNEQHEKTGDFIPFSAAMAAERFIFLSQGHLFGGGGGTTTASSSGEQGHLFGGKSAGTQQTARGGAGRSGPGHWVTIHGAAVFIAEGESIGKALRDHFGDKKKIDHTHVAGAARQVKAQGGKPNVEGGEQRPAKVINKGDYVEYDRNGTTKSAIVIGSHGGENLHVVNEYGIQTKIPASIVENHSADLPNAAGKASQHPAVARLIQEKQDRHALDIVRSDAVRSVMPVSQAAQHLVAEHGGDPMKAKAAAFAKADVATPGSDQQTHHTDIARHIRDHMGAAELPKQAAPTHAQTAMIDPARQFGMFSGTDGKGNPVEVGERPGQAGLFSNLAGSAVRKPEPAAVAPTDDDKETMQMFGQRDAGAAARPTTYHKGDRAEYTGKTQDVAGQKFHEVQMMEGADQGKTKLVATPPDGTNPNDDRAGREWKDQQEQFRRLTGKTDQTPGPPKTLADVRAAAVASVKSDDEPVQVTNNGGPNVTDANQPGSEPIPSPAEFARRQQAKADPVPDLDSPDFANDAGPMDAATARDLAADRAGKAAAARLKTAKQKAAPVTTTPEPAAGYSLAQHDEFLKKLGQGAVTPAELRDNYARVKEHAPAIKAELGKRKVDELNRLAGSYHKLTKDKAVDAVHQRMLGDHNVSGTLQYGMSSGSMEAARDAKVANATPEELGKYADEVREDREKRQRQIDATKSAISDPKTLEDYRTLARVKGADALTPVQMADYERLHAEKTRGERQQQAEQRANVAQVRPTEGLDIDIKQTTHSKTGKPLHVAVLNQRVERDKYTELNAAAKKLGGYYSSFRGAGAIPGFQFDTPEAAQQFKSVLSGNVNRTEDVRAQQTETRQGAAQRLRETADRMHAGATETLNADRKTNTARRADMASNIEGRARKDIAAAKTMHNVADALEQGTATALAGVRTRSHLDQLDTELLRAKSRAIQAADKATPDRPWADREADRDRAPNAADVAHVQYPYPSLWSNDLTEHATALANVPGLKNVGRTLAAAAKEAGPQFRGQAGGFKLNGGSIHSPESLKAQGIHLHSDKYLRVHQSNDWRLRDAARKQGHAGPVHTADAGKTWGATPVAAIQAAANKGNQLDFVDPPEHKRIAITDPDDIAQLDTAANRLKDHPDYKLQRIGESLRGQVEDYKRLRAANIHTPQELRTALREHLTMKEKTADADPVVMKERALRSMGKIPGFFPTPHGTIDRMLDAADIQPGHSVLEPSAGKGDILDAVAQREPEATTTAIEPHTALRDIIQAKGHNLAGHDFMQHTGQYDRIVMNPPFEGGAEIDHVRHAYDQLKPGGKMVSIMSEGPFQRQDAKASGFRDWLDEVGGDHEQLEAGTFAGADAFNQTGVSTRMVTIHKPRGSTNLSAARDAACTAVLALSRATNPQGKDDDEHEFSSTQVPLVGEMRDAIHQAASSVPDEDLADGGRETDPHVTALYGLHGDDPDAVSSLLAGERPPEMKLGDPIVFPATTERQSDVLVAPVQSDDLHRLHGKLSTLPHTSTFPEYRPHATIAYVKPGRAQAHADRLKGMAAAETGNSIVHSGRDGTLTDIPLGNQAVRLSASGDDDVLALSAAFEWNDADHGELPSHKNGLPIHYRWLDAAVTASLRHPKTGNPVPITRTRIDQWVKNAKLCLSRAVNLPACDDHKEEAAKTRGAIYDMRRDGDRLMVKCGFFGDDSLNVAQRNGVSLGIDRDFKDSMGNRYGEAIRHIALTPNPVVPGLTGFRLA